MVVRPLQPVDVYLIMRKQRALDLDSPEFHIGPRNPNVSLLSENAKVIIEKEMNGEIKFIGHATIKSIELNVSATPERIGERLVRLKDVQKFFPPRMKSRRIREMLNMLPSYHWYDSIRSIDRATYEKLLAFCSSNWMDYVEEEVSPTQRIIDPLQALLLQEESGKLEFKSTLRSPMQNPILKRQQEGGIRDEQSKDKTKLPSDAIKKEELTFKLEHSVIKTIAAFLNSEGGVLVIGVDDNKSICGIESDYATFHEKKNWDGWQQHLKNVISKYLGKEALTNIKVTPFQSKGKTVARIDVLMSVQPVYVRYAKNGKEVEEFHIRALNTTEQLSISQAANYLRSDPYRAVRA